MAGVPPAYVVEIAPDADLRADPGSWSWLDIIGDVRLKSAITMNRGLRDEGNRADPSTMDLVLNNRAGRYSTRNVESDLFGQIRRNTPIRLRMGADVLFEGYVPAWPTRWDRSGADCWVPLKAAGILRRLQQGTPRPRSAIEAAVSSHAQLAAFGAADPALKAYWPLEELVEPSANSARFLPHPFVEGSVDQLTGVPRTEISSATLLGSRSLPSFEVGASLFGSTFDLTPFEDDVWRFDFIAAVSQLPRPDDEGVTVGGETNLLRLQTSGALNDIQFRVNGEGDVIARSMEGVLRALVQPSFSVLDGPVLISLLVDVSTNEATLVASQALRGQTAVSESVVDRLTALRLSSAGHRASTPSHSSLQITGDVGLAAEVSPVDWASGSQQNIVAKWTTAGDQRSYRLHLQADGSLAFSWSTDGTTGGAQTALATVKPDPLVRQAVAAEIDVDNGVLQHVVRFYTAADINGPWFPLGDPVPGSGVTSIFSSSAELWVGALPSGNRFIGDVHAAEVRNGGIGGAVVADPRFSQQAASTASFADSTGKTWTVGGGAAIVGLAAIGYPRGFSVPAESPQAFVSRTVQVAVGHIAISQGTAALDGLGVLRPAYEDLADLAPWTSRALSSLNGWDGEPAGLRMVRVAAEHGVPFQLVDNSGDELVDAGNTRLMGPQPSGPVVPVLNECPDVDGGLLFEFGFGLGYRRRLDQLNQAPVLALEQGQLDEAPQPTDDDKNLRNSIRCEGADGGSVLVQDLVSIEREELYEQSFQRNAFDVPTLRGIANDLLRAGTVDEYRWPLISFNPAKHDLVAERLAMLEGRVITLGHQWGQLPGVTPVDLIVQGWTDTLTPYKWTVELNCIPASPWKVEETMTLIAYEEHRGKLSFSSQLSEPSELFAIEGVQLEAGFNYLIVAETKAGHDGTSALAVGTMAEVNLYLDDERIARSYHRPDSHHLSTLPTFQQRARVERTRVTVESTGPVDIGLRVRAVQLSTSDDIEIGCEVTEPFPEANWIAVYRVGLAE